MKRQPHSYKPPFGYAIDPNDPDNYIEVPLELECLAKTIEFRKQGQSLHAVRDWLVNTTGRVISHQGLIKIWKEHIPGGRKYEHSGLYTKESKAYRSFAQKTERFVKSLTPNQKRVLLLQEEAKKKRQELAAIRAQIEPKRSSARKKEYAARKLQNILDPEIKSTSNIMLQEELNEIPEKIREPILKEDVNIVFKPNPGPQTEFLAATEKEVFYGGARGGGKSYSLLIDPLRYCNLENERSLILRRTMPELRDLIGHSRKIYDKVFPGAKFREQEKEWKFPSGAIVEFGYAENAADALRYQGQAYTHIYVDELPQFGTPEVWNLLKGSLRSVDIRIPTYMRATGNPGNIGSLWVKDMFVDPAPSNVAFEVPLDLDRPELGTITRRFIPAKLADNPYLNLTKDYHNMLMSLPEIKRKQWLEGSWEAFEGAAFPEFERTIHVCEPFLIPDSWTRFRSCDWGYATNFCVLWFAVDFDNNLFVYKELYGKGLAADRFAWKVKDLEYGEAIQFGVMDSSAWSRRGDIGPAVPEIMAQYGCRWRPSDRSPGSRLSGKAEIHRRLALADTALGQQQPKLKIFSTCRNLIRTLPVLPLDENNQEDVDTDAEDHAYDALRYGCMSRPLNPSLLQYRWQQAQREQWQPASKVGY